MTTPFTAMPRRRVVGAPAASTQARQAAPAAAQATWPARPIMLVGP